MRICEVCGREEASENPESETIQTPIIHVCPDCQNDRKHFSIDLNE